MMNFMSAHHLFNSLIEIRNYAFYKCYALTEISIPSSEIE